MAGALLERLEDQRNNAIELAKNGVHQSRKILKVEENINQQTTRAINAINATQQKLVKKEQELGEAELRIKRLTDRAEKAEADLKEKNAKLETDQKKIIEELQNKFINLKNDDLEKLKRMLIDAGYLKDDAKVQDVSNSLNKVLEELKTFKNFYYETIEGLRK